jgi:hypothetical protein
MDKTYDYSDAWFLTTLILRNDWADIDQIIAIGDMINHAIFTQNEINQALQRLIPAGYIEVDNDKYRATPKAQELSNCVAYKRAGMCTKVDVILKRLNVKRCSHKPKSKIKSEYIRKIIFLCKEHRVKEIYRGKNPYDQTKEGEWVYFDCYFDENKIREKFNLPDTVTYYEYDGRASGQESGFFDEQTNEAVLGNHPLYGIKMNIKKIE